MTKGTEEEEGDNEEYPNGNGKRGKERGKGGFVCGREGEGIEYEGEECNAGKVANVFGLKGGGTDE
jgi:hypothetical protein